MVEAYGARLAVSAPDTEVLTRIIDGLPRGWTVSAEPVTEDTVEWRFAVLREGYGYRIKDGDGSERACPDLELAIWMLRTQMRRYIGHHAPDLVFIHSGVVAHKGLAILLPGPSFAGKSTLVAALVRAGADFYSDEFAILDSDGVVLQYREPLMIRGLHGTEEVDIGPVIVQPPISVGLVALAMYKPGAAWLPRRLTAAAGVLAMMEHAVPARERPAETLSTLGVALRNAVILQGERGEADETAQALLDAVAAMRN